MRAVRRRSLLPRRPDPDEIPSDCVSRPESGKHSPLSLANSGLTADSFVPGGASRRVLQRAGVRSYASDVGRHVRVDVAQRPGQSAHQDGLHRLAFPDVFAVRQ